MTKPRPLPIGTRFNRWVTLSDTFLSERNAQGKRKSIVEVRCACGTVCDVLARSLWSGASQSCGCLRDEVMRRTGRASNRYQCGGRGDRLAWLLEEKSQPCLDCGGRFPTYVMQFDHVPSRGPKAFGVNTQTAHVHSLDDLQIERDKCDLVCANCHAIRTNRRFYAK